MRVGKTKMVQNKIGSRFGLLLFEVRSLNGQDGKKPMVMRGLLLLGLLATLATCVLGTEATPTTTEYP